MSCPQCNHCRKEAEKEGLFPKSLELRNNEEKKETPKFPPRGPAREYSQAFEIAWKAYIRKEQKLEAFGVWLVRAKEVGGEAQLLTLVLGSLRWQVPAWHREGGPKYAPYFERYLKRRKWEDEPLPVARPQAVPQHVDDRLSQATDRRIADYRAAQSRALTPEQLEDIRKRGNGRG